MPGCPATRRYPARSRWLPATRIDLLQRKVRSGGRTGCGHDDREVRRAIVIGVALHGEGAVGVILHPELECSRTGRERGAADGREGLVALGRRIGIDRREIDPIALRLAEIDDRLRAVDRPEIVEAGISEGVRTAAPGQDVGCPAPEDLVVAAVAEDRVPLPAAVEGVDGIGAAQTIRTAPPVRLSIPINVSIPPPTVCCCPTMRRSTVTPAVAPA